MVIFDFIIMMPTLSINSISFLNQTFLTLCLVSKITWRCTYWCLPKLQRCFQMILTSTQSGNVQTEIRSPQIGNSTKSISLSKPEPLSEVKEHYKHTHQGFCPISKFHLLRPFSQTPCVHQITKATNTICSNEFGQTLIPLLTHR